MFTKITLKNFKVFDEIEFNLSDKKGKPLQYVFLYGENGAGKSSILESIDFLAKSFQTRFFYEEIEQLLINGAVDSENLVKFISKLSRTIKDLASKKKMADSNDEMLLQYDFLVNGKKVNYLLKFDDKSNLIEETLKYAFDKRIATVFSFTPKTIRFHKEFLISETYKDELVELKIKWWGKHTLLSILFNEFGGANDEYFDKYINSDVLNVIRSIFGRLVGNLSGLPSRDFINMESSTFNGINDIKSGKISSNNKTVLRDIENLLTDLFTKISPTINYVHYKVDEKDDEIEYKLFLNKKIANCDLDISVDDESRGTRNVIKLLPYFVKYFNNQICVLDEMDAGIHDLTFSYLVSNIVNYTSESGQLIASCHNTKIINELDAHNVFLIKINAENGIRSIESFADLDVNYRSSNDQERKYLRDYLNFYYKENLDFSKWNKE